MKPSEVCLDANIFVAAMVPEERDHEVAFEVLRVIQERDIVLYEPALVLFEVTSALHRKVFLGELTHEENEQCMELFCHLPLLLQWQLPLLKKSDAIATELSLKRMYDCAYLAVSMLRSIPLVSLDDELVKKGRKVTRLVQSAKTFLGPG